MRQLLRDKVRCFKVFQVIYKDFYCQVINVQFYCLLFVRHMRALYSLAPRKYGSTAYI